MKQFPGTAPHCAYYVFEINITRLSERVIISFYWLPAHPSPLLPFVCLKNKTSKMASVIKYA